MFFFFFNEFLVKPTTVRETVLETIRENVREVIRTTVREIVRLTKNKTPNIHQLHEDTCNIRCILSPKILIRGSVYIFLSFFILHFVIIFDRLISLLIIFCWRSNRYIGIGVLVYLFISSVH